MDKKDEDKLLEIINTIIRKEKDRDELNKLEGDMSLTNDIGFDSIDLAELTARIEDEFGVDVFEDGIVNKVSEVEEKLTWEV